MKRIRQAEYDLEPRDFWNEETAIGVVEIILILVVLISLVLIFKKQLTSLVKSIFSEVNDKAKNVY
ncbi:Flp1 family type IVb pilin [Qiania dongpingensis]|uniref:Putative Flagellin Flp1-like domain-containing protein n=1 Tax=Qiania dongpingensis TaxID=2763669 RepID=A0A7G9G179_9FIRM|nr:Flp1 family type IVb pilin [Qiania dongpingensis]QNM04561.1 hypothetical protein H9Q78_08745 [Qiania dongpingensis]